MATNKIVLRDIVQFMGDYTPVYNPLYSLFLGNSQQYDEETGQLTFKRLEAVGDIRTHHVTPKDTDIRQIAVKEGSKVFKKYFLATQFQQGALQDQTRTEAVVKQVLDELHKQADDLLLQGDGTSVATVVNNGLFWSGDSNYVLNNSAALSNGSDSGASALHAKVMEQYEIANYVAGRKAVIFYGSNVIPIVNGLFASFPATFRKVVGESLGGNTPVISLNSSITPASNHGFMIVNFDQLKLHYTTLPTLKAQGVNEEKMYTWHNFLMGSSMLECLASYAVIKQPCTFS